MCFPSRYILNFKWEREGDMSTVNSSAVDFQLSMESFLVGGEKVERTFPLLLTTSKIQAKLFSMEIKVSQECDLQHTFLFIHLFIQQTSEYLLFARD